MDVEKSSNRPILVVFIAKVAATTDVICASIVCGANDACEASYMPGGMDHMPGGIDHIPNGIDHMPIAIDYMPSGIEL